MVADPVGSGPASDNDDPWYRPFLALRGLFDVSCRIVVCSVDNGNTSAMLGRRVVP